MSYSDFDAADFIKDPFFKKWVYTPAPETDAFWHRYLEEHAEQWDKINTARTILVSLDKSVKQDYPTEEQVQRMFRTVQDRTRPVIVRQIPHFWRWAAAACVLLYAGWGFWQYVQRPSATIYQELISQAPSTLQERINNTSKPVSINLPDGSTVLLLPASRISFANDFRMQAKREVYLSGEGFFTVAKNPGKPFFVYANELVTKVLGTSFWIKATEADKQVLVRVKTGKVSVFARTDSRATEMKANRELEGVVLMPNQQLLFSRHEVRMKKSLVEQPEPIQPQTQEFRDAPVSQIFAALEQSYGVDIVYDEELLGNCLLTASLTDEPLFEKLTLVCKGIEGHYQVVDAQIIVSAKGCQQH